jgi:hypothetical protein
MACPCCLQTPCVALCRMPNELEATITYAGVAATFQWAITQAEEDTLQAFFEGTYALQYSQYTSGQAVYLYQYPDPPYDFTVINAIRYRWRCTASSGVSGTLDLLACSTTSSALTRYFSGSANTPSADFPDITNYCTGTAFSNSVMVTTVVLPDTTCAISRQPGDRGALIDLDISLSD